MSTPLDTRGIGGHPAGLTTLFLTELWERFSYYGMRAILVLFMVAPLAEGGLGFDTSRRVRSTGPTRWPCTCWPCPAGSSPTTGWASGGRCCWAPSSWRRGSSCWSMHSLPAFYTGLALIAVGTGLLKPNISAMVGSLYGPGDPRRDSGFSIFYMGINVGALMAPLACGWLAESPAFKGWLAGMGVDPARSWHFGFGAAGVGMLIGIAVYVAQRDRLPQSTSGPARTQKARAAARQEILTRDEWKRIGAIVVLFAFTIMFWAAYEQKGASLNLFAKRLVDTNAFGFQFPASWLQSLTPLYVILLAPVFAKMWVRLGTRQPSSPAKFALGLLAIGMAFCLLVPASALTASGKISPMWLVGVYFFDVVGELCLSPVGLSTVTKLSPARFVGLMMGLWFFATSLGNKLAGFLSGFFVADDPGRLMRLYGGIAVALLASSVLLVVLTPRIRRWSGEA